MKVVRSYCFLVVLLLSASLHAQLVQPIASTVFTKDGAANRFTLYVPDSNQLMVFQHNKFWLFSKDGKQIGNAGILREDGGDPWYPRISLSGKMIAYYIPGKGWLSEDNMALYDRDSGYVIGTYKTQLASELEKIRFSGDSLLFFYSQYRTYRDIYVWYTKNGAIKNNFLNEDTVHSGTYDIGYYKDKGLGIARDKDSLALFIVNINSKKEYYQMFKLKSATVKNFAQITQGYPYAIVGDESTGQTKIYKTLDTSFQLVATLDQLPEIYAAAGSEDNCYILYKDTTQKDHPVFKLYNTRTNSSIVVIDVPVNTTNYTFNIYPEQKIFTASHPTNGNIIAFDLADAKQAWASSPQPSVPGLIDINKMANADNKLFKVLIKQGSDNVRRTYYNDKTNQLYLLKTDETLVTVDADAKCATRWEQFNKDDERVTEAELMPGNRYILFAEKMWKEDLTSKDDIDADRYRFQYPFSYKVYDRRSGKTIFDLRSKEAAAVNILNDSLICWSEGSYLSPEDHITIYNLNTGISNNIYPFSQTDIQGYKIMSVGNKLYYFFATGEKLFLTNDKGKKIFGRSYTKEGSIIDRIAFVENSPYFYFQDMGNNVVNQLYSIKDDSVTMIRKFPLNISILAAKATGKDCYFMYEKKYQRKGSSIYHRRMIDMITGQDKLIDSTTDNKAFVTFEIFPEENFYTENYSNVISWHDLNTGYEFKNFGRDEATITSIAYSPDGRYLAAAEPDGKVKLWDLGTGKETRSLTVGSSGYITKLAFSGDGQYLAASSGDIWETATGKNVVSVTDGGIWAVNSIDFSIDGKRIVSGGDCIISWDAADGSKLYYQQYPHKKDMDTTGTCWNPNGCVDPNYTLKVYSTALHPNSKDFVTGGVQGFIQKWNTEDDKRRTYKILEPIQGQTDAKVYDLKYTRDGNSIIAVQQKCIYRLNANTLNVEDSLILPDGEEILGIDMGYDGQVFGCITRKQNGRIVQIRNINDLQVKQEFYTDGASFNKISFSPNKKQAATASEDGFCTIWDLATGEPVMYLNTIGEYGNIMVTPDNYYMASKSALDGVTFFKDSSFYSFDQFDLYLNRPDIILSRLGYASPELVNFYKNAYYKRLKKATGSMNDTVFNDYAPSLKLVNKKLLPNVTAKTMVGLNFEVTDSSAQKGKLQVFINGNLVKEYQFNGTGNDTLNYADSVILGQGSNNIEAVYRSWSSIESRKEKVTVSYLPAKPEKARVWFIGIGVSKYKDADMSLKYPVKDIKDLAAAFRKKYPNLIVDTLLNENATKENILALHDKLKNTSVNDKIIVSFNGHGLLSDSLDWYFATYDVDFKKPQIRGLSYAMMEGVLNDIPARQKLLLMDACHSGEVDKESDITFENKDTHLEKDVVATARGLIVKGDSKVGLQTSFELMQELFANLSNGNGTTVLSAAGGKEYALESDTWKNGVFTYSILKALNDTSTDEDGDKKISVKELKKAVFTAVRTLTGGRQKPTSRVEASDGWNIW